MEVSGSRFVVDYLIGKERLWIQEQIVLLGMILYYVVSLSQGYVLVCVFSHNSV